MKYLKLYEATSFQDLIREKLYNARLNPYRGWIFEPANGYFLWRKQNINKYELYIIPCYTYDTTIMTQLYVNGNGYNREEINILDEHKSNKLDNFIEWYLTLSHNRIDIAEKVIALGEVTLNNEFKLFKLNVDSTYGKLISLSNLTTHSNNLRFYFQKRIMNIWNLNMETMAKIYDVLVDEYPDIDIKIRARDSGFLGE